MPELPEVEHVARGLRDVIVGKRFDTVAEVSIDRIPAAALVPGASVTADHVGEFAIPLGQPYGPTGADVDASGDSIGLLFYAGLTLVWHREPGADLVSTLLDTEPCEVDTGFGQYEALAIADDGTLYVATEGTDVPVWAHVPAGG